MATFKNPFYRGELVFKLLQHFPRSKQEEVFRNKSLEGLFDFVVEDGAEVGGYPNVGWARDLIKREVYGDNNYLSWIIDRCQSVRRRQSSIAFEKLVEGLGVNGYKSVSGFKACFMFTDWVYFKRPNFKKDLDYDHIRNCAVRAFELGVRASYGGRNVAYKFLDDLKKSSLDNQLELAEYYENAANQISHIKHLYNDKKYKRRIKDARTLGRDYPYIENSRIFRGKYKGLQIYRREDITIIEHHELKLNLYFLNKDLTRISQMLRSIGLIYEYFYFYPKVNQGVNDSISVIAMEMVSHIMTQARSLDADKINNLCRAYNVTVFHWLAKIGADITDKALKEMEKKIEDEELDSVGDIKGWMNFVKNYKIAEQAELLHIYKFIYVGDFCLNSSMEKFRARHKNTNLVTDLATYDDFMLYRKLAFIRYYKKEKGRMPGAVLDGSRFTQEAYEQLDVYKLKLEDVEFISLTGVLDFVVRDADVIRFAKDKVTNPVEDTYSLSTKHLDAAPLHETNYLVGFLQDEKMSSPEYVMQAFAQWKSPYEVNLRTALKPEAKKRDARLFTIANRYDRLMVSMIEDNIDEFIRGKNGVFTGLSHMEKKRMFRKFCSPMDTFEHNGTDSVLVSFDLKGFSPLMDPKVKEDMYNFWSDIYDTPQVKNAYRIFQGTNYIQRKYGFDTGYKLSGNDIEGFNARMNTDFHVDLMAFAVYRLQKMKLVDSGARLAVLIDDGFLKLIFRDEVDKEYIDKVLDQIELVYAAASMQISWDKTIVSRKSGIFLNEIVYDGAFVTPGVKSYMKIGPDKGNNLATFAEECNEIYANAQGASSSGCGWLPVYYRYLKEIFKSRSIWDRKNVLDVNLEVIRAITPVNLGGFGVSPLLTLVSNESQSQVSTGISFLRVVALLEPNYKKMVLSIINQEKKVVEPLTFLRNPVNVRAACRIVHNRRIDTHIKEVLGNITKNVVVREALNKSSEENIVELYNMFKAIGSVDTNTVVRAYNATPEALMDNIVLKFQRSTTLSAILPTRVRFQIAALNVSDVKGNSRHWATYQ